MKKIYHLIFLLIIIIGCNKDDENNPVNESDPHTVVTEQSDIIEVSENTIILNGSNSNLDINDIIVSGANAKAPRGFLRKIKAINTVDGQIVLNTERTSLEEGLKYFETEEDTLSASFNHIFTQNEGRSPSKQNFNIILEIDETISVNGIDLNLNGDLEITPSLSGNIIIKRNAVGLPYLETLELISQTQNNLSLTLSLETELSFDEEILLGSFQSSPITIFLGGFPVVVIPKVTISVGANGQINAQLSYSYTNNSTFTAGIRYDENWHFPDSNGFVVNDAGAETNAQVTGSAEVYIKPEFGISLYDEGFVNTGINVKPYARFEGSINTNGYEYGVYGGITAGAFFKASIFGFNLVDKEWEDLIMSAEYEIISGNSNASTPTVTTATISNITDNSAQSGGNVTDDGGNTVTTRGICWSTSPNPTIGTNTTNNGSGLGNFISQLTGLESNTIYYVRAYATNTVGTAYGNQLTFTTLGSGNVSPAFNPIPADGTTNIPLNGTLSFTPGNNTPANATFKLYFGTNQNPTTSFNLGTSTNFSYNNLEENTNYYWKIETISNTNQVLATSSIWNFKTLLGSGNIYYGNVLLTTQQEVTDFGLQNYTQINGNLKIVGQNTSEITSLAPLISLNTINGDFEIRSNLSLTTLNGLNNLQTISGVFNVQITRITNFQGIASLSYIKSLGILQNPNLVNLTGLENITTIPGFVSIWTNTILNSLNGLNNLQHTGENFSIQLNNSLINLEGLNSFVSINPNYDFIISLNDSLQNLNGLEQLNILNEIIVMNNNTLKDFCALSNLIINGNYNNYSVMNNQYNPTEQDIIDGYCSQ
jgi:hypothetical protein